MHRTYGIADRLVALVATLALTAAGCQGGGGGDDPDGGPGPGPGAGEFDGADGPESAVDVAAEVEQRRLQPNPLAASAPVGTIGGSASVDAIGGAHYSFPIDVPPGPGGMQPEVAISYDSGRGVGDAGIGFTIDGFGSTIERCNKTIADHGEADRIRLEDDDALCFGGRPLVLVSGMYGQAGSEYRARRDPFEKIVLLDQGIQDRASRWEAWLQDGRVIEYSSKIKTGDPTQVPLRWYADRIRDRYDNALEYTWAFDETSIRPASITYGSGREVRFDFHDLRPGQTPSGHSASEVRTGYVAGRYFEEPYLLERIEVYGTGGTHLWDYNFSYDVVSETQQSALESVEKCDAAGACLPKTWFTWDQVLPADGSIPDNALAPDLPPVTPPPEPFVLSAIGQEYVNGGFEEIDFSTENESVDVNLEQRLRAAWASGAYHVMDLDGNGTDEVLVQDFDTGHFVLDPDASLPGMPDPRPAIVWVDMLDTVAFPDPGDTSLNSPSAASVALEDRTQLESFGRDLLKCQNSTLCDPGDWTFSERDELSDEVVFVAEPDENDELSSLAPMLSVSTDWLPP